MQVSWAEDDEEENFSKTEQVSPPSASSIPAMTPEQAKMLMEKSNKDINSKKNKKKPSKN